MSEPSMGNVSRIGVLTILLIGASPLAAEPFGVATVPAAPDSRISAIWRDLQPAMRADEQTIVVCRANPACGSPAALRFIAIVDEALVVQPPLNVIAFGSDAQLVPLAERGSLDARPRDFTPAPVVVVEIEIVLQALARIT